MIIVQGTFTVDPDTRDEYLAQSVEQMRISRSEKGCQEYVLADDPREPGRVILSERWDSREDLYAHVSAITERREAASRRGDEPGLAPLDREITIYEVTSAESM